MINIIIAFWIGLLVGLVCFALSNANKEAEKREIDMWRLKIEREKAEEIERLKKRVEALEDELHLKNIIIERMADRLANVTSTNFDSVIDTFNDIAKEILIEEATR